MRPRGHTTIAWISLAGYLLALAGAVVFHDHAHHEHHAAGAAADESQADARCHSAASHAGECCHHGHDHPPADVPEHGHHPAPDAPHEDCAICQFLALKVLTSAAPATMAAPEVIEIAAVSPPPAVSVPEPWRPLSRGPPAAV